MGWLGVAVVVATTCFLLYRHPPTSWFPDSPAADQARTEPTTEEKANPRATEGDATIPNVKPESQPTGAENKPTEESQTTPKASASISPALNIPSFQLDEDKADRVAGQEVRQDTPQITNTSLKPQPTISALVDTMTKTDPRPTSQPPVATDTSLMPPPPPPSRLQPPAVPWPPQRQVQNNLAPPQGRFPPQLGGRSAGSTLSPPPSAASSLRAPPGRSSSNSLSPNKVTLKPAKKASQRVILEPGYSPLDWAALTSNPNHKLRGENLPPGLIKVTPSMLKAQHGRKGTDAWTSYQGKVYNITPYLPFHPGGKGELLRGAGKDSGKLFLEIHPWVNWDAMLGECMVGILVSEHESVAENQLDAMD
ncbi:hypothetical protein BJX99DRAFT_173938 [Aspergillus californicus]